jgi:CRISPR-associated endonuclease/helicase Cas3
LQWLMNGPPERLGAYSWWRQPPQDALLTGMLPQHQPFRAEAGDDIELCLQPDDAAALGMRLTERREHPRRGRPALWVEIDRSRHQPIEDSRVQGRGIQPWGPSNYLQALHELAEARGLSAEACARRYGLMTLRRQDPASSWQLRFHAALGFTVV